LYEFGGLISRSHRGAIDNRRKQSANIKIMPAKEANAHDDLLETLRQRFERHPQRHPVLKWSQVLEKLQADPSHLRVLAKMEATGGEPDVIEWSAGTGEITFCDCSPESPKGRRSLCYDKQARLERKEHAPEGSALEMAAEIGVELITEEAYRRLQTLGEFDLKTSSWLKTPPDIRERGGAIFADRRYDAIFVYHNGVQSYYASRGFRGVLRV
jgi:hypothetical protein